MGSMNVYDDGSQGWGSIGSGFASAIMNAPQKAAENTHLIETIRDQRIARQREQEKYDAAQGSIAAFPGTLQKDVAPVTTLAPFVGDMSNPDDTAGVPVVQYTDPRQQAQLEAYNRMATAAFKQNALAGKPEQFGPLVATATVGGAGVPSDLNERNRLNFLANNKFMTDTERALPQAHNAMVQGPNGEVIDQYSSRNGVSTEDGRRIANIRAKLQPDQRILASGAASTELTPNPIESVPIAQNNFNILADKIMKDAAAGKPPQEADLLNAIKLRDNGWQPEIKLERDGNNRLIPITVPKTPPPTEGAAGYLFQVLKDREARLRGASTPPPTTAPTTAPGAGARRRALLRRSAAPHLLLLHLLPMRQVFLSARPVTDPRRRWTHRQTLHGPAGDRLYGEIQERLQLGGQCDGTGQQGGGHRDCQRRLQGDRPARCCAADGSCRGGRNARFARSARRPGVLYCRRRAAHQDRALPDLEYDQRKDEGRYGERQSDPRAAYGAASRGRNSPGAGGAVPARAADHRGGQSQHHKFGQDAGLRRHGYHHAAAATDDYGTTTAT